MDDIIKDFLVESYENLDRLDREFVELEKNPQDKNLLSSIFRVIHTIKGTCGFLDFKNLEGVTHVGENLLSQLRDGKLILNSNIVSALLAMIDAVREMLSQIEKTSTDGNKAYPEVVQQLTACMQGDHQTIEKAAEAPVNPPAEIPPVVQNTAAETLPPENPAPEEVKPHHAETAAQAGGEPNAQNAQETSIRVNVELLDKLMNLVGELVLSRNQIIQYTLGIKDANFTASTQRLSLITSELQEKVMKTRLQPISNIWNKFPRVVRDVSTTLNKKVKIIMRGEDTEIDKSIIEAIKDPLTHIIRNSIDHGIERPEIRKARGKNEEGTISLHAYHEGGQVIMEMSDDGNGIDLSAVKNKALKLNWFTQAQLDKMCDQEIYNLILMPGFSTAAQVTAISGRGVGMDVVKTQVEKIGGLLDIISVPQQKMSIKIKIPLTLSIIPALIVDCGQAQYAIPQVNVVELLLLENENSKKIEWIHNLPIYRLRGKLLPLIRLRDLLTGTSVQNASFQLDSSVSIVVLKAVDQQFGLIVDKINDTQDIVVKALTKLLKGLGIYVGATIMGQGQVALILDALGLAQKSGLSNVNLSKMKGSSLNADNLSNGTKQKFLILLSGQNQIAVPLSYVARLEMFNNKDIESSGHLKVIQYRGSIMPLIDIKEMLYKDSLHTHDDNKASVKQVVVVTNGKEYVGFLVEKILDTVEQEITSNETFARDMVCGSAVIKGKVTEILNIDNIVNNYLPKLKQRLTEKVTSPV